MIHRPNPSSDAMQPSDVSEGSWVILLLAGGERRLVQVRPGAKLHVGRQHCTLDPLIGKPFGANFRVEPVGLVRDSRTIEEISGAIGDVFAGMATAQPGATNAKLFDDSTAQQLGEKEISALKEAGTHGAELVKTIAQNSLTFASKTAFAQEKYLKKKAKKHMPTVSVIRPSALTICDLYMAKVRLWLGIACRRYGMT